MRRSIQFFKAARNAARVRITGARLPAAIRIQVTSRCHLGCLYCTPPGGEGSDLSTGQLRQVLNEAAELGCLRVSFSGGEPMLRQDMGELVDHCADLGMVPEMNSSGLGIPGRMNELGRLELLKLSLDGPEDVHDNLCGQPGAYQQVLDALSAATARGIHTVLVTTITRQNVDCLDHVLDLARRHGVMAAFQPLKPNYKGFHGTGDLLPEPEDMLRAVDELRAARRDGGGANMRNSIPALDHIASWPNYSPMRCWAGRIFCVVGADGTLYPCDRTPMDAPLPNCLELGLRESLNRLPELSCDGCGFCGAMELNLALRPDPRIVGHLLRMIGR